jgi:hypothetical protein
MPNRLRDDITGKPLAGRIVETSERGAMMMTDGTEVWVAFATGFGHDGKPKSRVERGVVVSEEFKIVKRDSGHVGPIAGYGVETVHYTEAAAWRHCADKLMSQAHEIEEEAARCMQRVGRLVSDEAVSV